MLKVGVIISNHFCVERYLPDDIGLLEIIIRNHEQ